VSPGVMDLQDVGEEEKYWEVINWLEGSRLTEPRVEGTPRGSSVMSSSLSLSPDSTPFERLGIPIQH